MAKKTAENTSKTSSLVDDLINQQFTEMKDLSKEDNSVKNWIDSGNYALNYVSSKNFNGAYPMHQISFFAGKSGVGKSMLPAIAAKDEKIDRVLIFDSEGEGAGTGSSLFEFVGAPVEKVRYVGVKTLDCYKIRKADGKIEGVSEKEMPDKLNTDTFEYHRGLISYLKKIIYALEYNNSEEETLIIIDSLSNMCSSRQLSGTSDMAFTGQLLNQLFSALDVSLEKAKVTILMSIKTYTDVNNPYNTDGILKGGESVIYNPSLGLVMSQLQDNPELSEAELSKEKEQRKTGLGNSIKTIRVKVKKSRFGTEGRNAWVILDATYGLTRNSGLFQLLLDFGVCVKNGARYSIPGIFVNEKGEDISFYKKEFPEIFSKNEKEYIEKLQKVMDIKEEDIRKKRLNLNVNDADEAREEIEDEDVNTFDMARAMEAEREQSQSEE